MKLLLIIWVGVVSS